MNGPFTTGRVRLQLAQGGGVSNQFGGSTPQFYAGTGVQFELSAALNSAIIDASALASVMLEIKPSSDEDAKAIVWAKATPSSAGWNSNAAATAGQQLVPSYATYSGAGPYTYVVGVQTGATYAWVSGANDLTLSNNGAMVAGSQLVPYGAAYSGGAYSLTGLTAGAVYGYFLGADDASLTPYGGAAATGSGFFVQGNGTTATLAGSGSSAVTAEVYAATLSNNIVPGNSLFPTTALVATGSSLPNPANYVNPGVGLCYVVPSLSATVTTYSTAVSGQTYGTATLQGLVPGVTYAYSLGAQDLSIAGITAATAQNGLFTPTTSTVVLTGVLNTNITTKIYATQGASSTYGVGGLTVGQTYFYKLNGSASVNGSVAATGFFTASTSQVSVTGPGGAAVSATVQPVSVTTTASFVAASNTVAFSGYSGAAVTAQLTGNVGWQQATDQLCIVPFSASQTGLSADGVTTPYWMLVTAVTNTGTPLVLGAGTVSAVDVGQASGVPATNNIVPGAAKYDGSGFYALAVTPGFVFYWSPGSAADTGVLIPALSAAGTFYASASSVTLTGTAGHAVEATVYAVNQRPYTGQAVLAAGQTVLSTALSLAYTPMGGRCDVMIPNNTGTPVSAPLDFSTLGPGGGTFRFNVPIPASGYVAIYTFY